MTMREHLILKLHGVMQAWGEHTFEGLRPSTNFPTRSALIGLLSACLGIDRSDHSRQQDMADSFLYAARQDESGHPVLKMSDYHTVKNARKEYSGLKWHDTIVTQREYLLDARFTVVLWSSEDPPYTLYQLEEAVQRPHFTPFLGRRSCPITRPLFDRRLQANTADEALKEVEPCVGVIYSEENVAVTGSRNKHRYQVRDVPMTNRPRQFASRMIYVYGKEDSYVSE